MTNANIIPPNLQKKNSEKEDSSISCSLCNDTGWIVDENNNARQCKCYKMRMLNSRIKFANIPESFKDIRLNSFKTGYYKDKTLINDVVKVIKYYTENLEEMANEGIGLYLWSETKGSGKTRMATSLANEFIYEHEMSVKFATSMDILNEIKRTWESDDYSESKLLSYLTSCEVLVIDDFGTETHRDWIDDKFYQIINKRYIDKLITIFTSNHNLDDLEYDNRITNRIKERVYQVHFPEESIRSGIAQARQQKMMKEIMANG